MKYWSSWSHSLLKVRTIVCLLDTVIFIHILDISKAQQKNFIGYLDDLHGKHRALPSWEQKLKAAQKVLFNHELFSQVSMAELFVEFFDMAFFNAVVS